MSVDASKFPPLSVTGIGDVRGLLGANCRHSIGPGDGRFNPYEGLYDSEENRKREELDKKQRAMERRIRATKRLVQGLKAALDAAEDPADREELQAAYQKEAAKLTEQNKAYNAFCEETGQKPLRERLQIAGWDRKQVAQAAAAGRKAAQDDTLKLEAARVIIKQRVADGEYSLKLSRQQFLKHVEGTAQYDLYLESRRAKGMAPQSIITVSEEDAQDILRKYYGTGNPRVRRNGVVADAEFVTVDHVVGKWCTPDGRWKPTKRAALHYGKRGSHVVPVEEKDG